MIFGRSTNATCALSDGFIIRLRAASDFLTTKSYNNGIRASGLKLEINLGNKNPRTREFGIHI